MSISADEKLAARAVSVTFAADALCVDLDDGRSLQVPLAWFPRLLAASNAERANWRLLGLGEGIHWPDIDEDVSVESLLAGRPSHESQDSLRRWLATRDR